MGDEIIGQVLIEIIRENKKIFLRKELEIIEKEFETIKKIYILGLLNAKDVLNK